MYHDLMYWIRGGLMSFLTWFGRVLNNLLSGELSLLLPIIGLGIAFGVIGFAISKIKSLTWGF